VVTLECHEDIPIGTIGTIASRWLGTIYAVILPNGDYHWLDSSEIGSIDPSRHILRVGDTAIITSDKHQHPLAKKGDLVRIVKIIDDADYYGVILNDKLHWLAGFELGNYI
jgi:hypothetical protein